jgi:hypothetical protein
MPMTPSIKPWAVRTEVDQAGGGSDQVDLTKRVVRSPWFAPSESGEFRAECRGSGFRSYAPRSDAFEPGSAIGAPEPKAIQLGENREGFDTRGLRNPSLPYTMLETLTYRKVDPWRRS